MMQLPEKKICYIFPLEMEVSTPEKLINDLDKANGVRKCQFYFSDVPFNSSAWKWACIKHTKAIFEAEQE